MALVLADRVQETTTTSGTGSVTLAGAVAGFQTFAVVGNGNTCYYTIVDGSAWEVGVGTYSTSGPTLARTTILSNSNGNTTAITLSAGTKTVFLTYPAETSVNLNASGNVSPLGTVSSGTWQGSTIGVAYGGTGVTSSSGANSVVLRDSNQNITVNRLNQGIQTVTAAGGTTTLTAASAFNQTLNGTGGQTYRLPDATTLTDTTAFQFSNNSTGTLTLVNNANAAVATVAPGGAAGAAVLNNATVAGDWDVHGYLPESVTWGTNLLSLGTTSITGGTWNGGTIATAYGGTGLTTFTAANGALYSTSASALAAGTLPVAAGGTGQTTYTDGQLLIGNSTGNTLTKTTLTAGTGISVTNGSGAITIAVTGGAAVTSVTGTSPVVSSGGTTPAISLASGYGDTQNPYASKTANYVLAAPNGSAGAPTFRAIVAADIPTLNQNTTGNATTATTASNLFGGIASQIPYQTGAGATSFIANGTAGQVLTSNGTSAPSWQAAGGGGLTQAKATAISLIFGL